MRATRFLNLDFELSVSAYRAGLGALLLLAVSLRLPHLPWGFPLLDDYSTRFVADETHFVNVIHGFPKNLGALTFTDIVAPSAAPILATLTYPVRLVVRLFGAEPQLQNASVELALKCLYIGASLALILLVSLWLLRATSSRVHALIGAAFAAVAPLLVDTSTQLKPAPVTGLLITSYVYLVWCLDTRRLELSPRTVAASTLLLGLAVGTKYNAIVFVVAFLYLVAKMLFRRHFMQAVTYSLIGGISASAGFFLCVPTALFRPSLLLETYSYISQGMGTLPVGQLSSVDLALRGWRSLATAFGYPILAFCVLGVILSLQQFRRYVLFYLTLGAFILLTSSYPLPRYYLPMAGTFFTLGTLGYRRMGTRALALAGFLVVFTSVIISMVDYRSKLFDNRREISKQLSRAPKGTYRFVGSGAHRPRIPSNLTRAMDRAEIVVVATPDVARLQELIRQGLTEDDRLIFEGTKPLYRLLDRRYYYGYPSNLADWELLNEVFFSETYHLESSFRRKRSFFRSHFGLPHWEPELYIFRRRPDCSPQ